MHMQGDRGRRAYAATGARLSAIAASIAATSARTPRPLRERSLGVTARCLPREKPKTVHVQRGELTPRAGAACVCVRRLCLRAPPRQRGERCDAPVGVSDLPFLLTFCFPSPRTRLKSPLGEPRSRCQATRLPGSEDLINGDSVMQVAEPTRRTAGRTSDKHMRVCKCTWARAQRGRTGHRVHPCEASLGFGFDCSSASRYCHFL